MDVFQGKTATEYYSNHKWIKVKKFEEDPKRSVFDNYVNLEKHHIEETTFLIEEIRGLAKQLDDAKAVSSLGFPVKLPGPNEKTDLILNTILKTLNCLLACDKETIGAMVTRRYQCNQDLASHSNVPIWQKNMSATRIGLLGVINAVLADLEGGYLTHRIAVRVDKDDNVLAFVEYKEPELLEIA